jgi:spore coat protein U-like protein
VIAALLGLGSALASSAASAQSCNFSIAPLIFSSMNLAANTTFTSTTTFQASCTGTPNTIVRTCPNIDVGSGGSTTGSPRFLLNGATQLNFNLYQDGGYASVWGSNLWGFAGSYPSPTVDVQLNGSGTGSASQTIYGQVWAGQQTLPAGTYSSTFAGTQAQVGYAYSTVGTCATIGNSLASNAPFTVTATNSTICSVSVATLNFGTTGVLRSNVDATTTVSVTCTNQAPYTVALDGGQSGATDPTQRKMTHGGVSVTYGLYQDSSRTNPWGDSTGVNMAAGTGSGLSQSLTIYGRVPPQTTPAPGTYSDTVVLTLSY